MDDTQNAQTSLTMIIPTRERSDFLERALFYYFTIGFKHKIIIADSSTKKHIIRNKETIEKVNSKLNISHEIYDETMEIVEKLDKSLSHVKTPYVFFGDDDDFFVPKTLELALVFLHSNPEYSCVNGKGLEFSMGSQKCYGKINFMRESPQKSIEDDNTNNRLIKHLSAYIPNWASVRRTNQAIDEWNFVKKYNWDIRFMELIPSCLSIIQGKQKNLDCLCMFRQKDSPKSYVPAPSVTEWVSNPSWGPQYIIFSQILCEYLVLRANMDMDTAKKTVNTAFLLYLTPSLYYERENEMKKYWMKPTNRFSLIVNLPIKTIFQYWMNIFLDKIRLYKLRGKSSPFYSDLQPIIEAVECETYIYRTENNQSID